MSKRMLQMLVAVAVFLGAIGFFKFQQISGAIAAGKSWQPPPEAVTTAIAQSQQWRGAVDAVGSVAPVRGVTLSADQPGIVDGIEFESGARVQAGQALVTLDTRQERAQLASAEAARDLAKLNLDRSRSLLDQKLVAQADFDQVAAQYKQADANVSDMKAAIERKTIRAPFSGTAGIREVNLGQYLHSGDPVVPLQSMVPIYVNFGVPQQDVAEVKVGDVVWASADSSMGGEMAGRVTAINPVVDDATRNVQVQATFPNARERLRPGMYVTVRVSLASSQNVVALPASAINYAPYGNSVFIVEQIKGPNGQLYRGVRQQFVKLGAARGDLVAVTSGVTPGQEVVTSGVFKLRTGVAVTVNNAVQPSASPAPKPEDS